MKVNSICSCAYPKAVKKIQPRTLKQEPDVNHAQDVAFKGVKGAVIGAGAGALWAGAVITMTAVTAPYLLPAITGFALKAGTVTGAIAGNGIENEIKNNSKK